MSLNICTLASGSKGNCIYISDGKTSVLIDAGISLRTLKQRAKENNINLSSVSAVISTHCHTDHCSGIRTFMDGFKIPSFVHIEGLTALSEKTNVTRLRLSTFTQDFSIGSLQIQPLKLNHDVPHCSGFIINNGESSVGAVMDLGEIDNNIISALKGVKTLIIESNHDEHMLKTGRYPYHLKRRILSNSGHLSNDMCAGACLELIKSGTKNILLAHLSEENNLPELAFSALTEKLLSCGFQEGKDYHAEVALQHKTSKMIVG